MSRKIKNVIMIILIIALCVSMYFTANYQNNKLKNEKQRSHMTFEESQDMPEGEMREEPKMQDGEKRKIGEMPTRPEGENSKISKIPENLEEQENQEIQDGQMNKENFKYMERQDEEKSENINGNFERNNWKINILLVIESLGIALILIYLVMSKFNKKNLKETLLNSKKILIYILLVSIVTVLITVLAIYLNKNNLKIENNMPIQEMSKEKETTAESVDPGKNVTETNIDLSKYNSNITITEAGNYTISGEFNYSILINADEEVTLNLNNVTIKNDVTATIANISTNGLILNLPESTETTLSDGGSSEYDGCIYSAGPLTIMGSGKLNVYGNQEEGEGIATETNDITINGGNINIECNDDGINAGGDGGTITINGGNIYIKASGDGIDSNKDIVINGGTIYSMGSSVGGDAGIDSEQGIIINGGSVIALGSDMLEKPLKTSKQYSLSFNLDSTVESGSTITLKNDEDEEILTFEANEKFKTLIISNEKIEKEKYYLYKNGEQILEIENN